MNGLILFEVMDNEPTVLLIWTTSLVLGVGGFLLSRYKWWLGSIVVLIAIALSWAQISEVRDAFVGPAIIREAGYGYVVHSYVASTISVVLPLVALILEWRNGGMKNSSAS